MRLGSYKSLRWLLVWLFIAIWYVGISLDAFTLHFEILKRLMEKE